jgi:hypothetical protein
MPSHPCTPGVSVSKPATKRQWYETEEMHARRLAHLQREITVGQEQSEPIRDGWSRWLKSYPWEAWGTLTFRDNGYTADGATRAFAKFAHRTWASPEVAAWFVGHEVGSMGRLHMHFLFAALSKRRTEVWADWFKCYGRAQIVPYGSEKPIAEYVTKYVSKELAHYDLNLRGFEWLSQLQQKNSSTLCTSRGRRRV